MRPGRCHAHCRSALFAPTTSMVPTLADSPSGLAVDRKAAESGFFLDATNEIEAACGLVLGAPAMPVVAS